MDPEGCLCCVCGAQVILAFRVLGAAWCRALSQHKRVFARFFILITVIPICPRKASVFDQELLPFAGSAFSSRPACLHPSWGDTGIPHPGESHAPGVSLPCSAPSSGAATAARRGSQPCSHQLPKETGPVQHLELLHQSLLPHLVLPLR